MNSIELYRGFVPFVEIDNWDEIYRFHLRTMIKTILLAVIGTIALGSGAAAAECSMMELIPLLSQFDASCSAEVKPIFNHLRESQHPLTPPPVGQRQHPWDLLILALQAKFGVNTRVVLCWQRWKSLGRGRVKIACRNWTQTENLTTGTPRFPLALQVVGFASGQAVRSPIPVPSHAFE